jgi:HD-GYP domain-containing protein (c-di-GMP phosphodiesterase class II)
MSQIILHYPVHTVDDEVLLTAGAVLSPKVLNSLVASRKKASNRTYSLLRYGTVRKDLCRFLGQTPYNAIFENREAIAGLLDLLGNIRLVLPVLQSMEYFRRHDFYTYRHILMVCSLATLLARDLLSDHMQQIRETATGPTHDLGKICIPLKILKKSSPLTRIERGLVEHHAAAGYVLLSYYLGDHGHIAARVCRDHHERRDGSGYPRGVRLADRMVEIVAVCDIYDALISPRPYRPCAYDNRTALEEITRYAERNQIGWTALRALIARNRKSKPHYRVCPVSLTSRGIPPAENNYGIVAEENSSSAPPPHPGRKR